MTTISAELISQLRKMTDAPILDCKKALQEANGDIQTAIENMRKAGVAKAAKREGRVAAEGIIAMATSSKGACMVEVNSETDFVGRSDEFTQFAQRVAEIGLNRQTETLDVLLTQKMDGDQTVEETRSALVAKVGENIQIRRVCFMPASDCLGTYVHGGRIGVMVAMTQPNDALAKDIAMHIAAANPRYVTPEEVPAESIEKEKEIFMVQARQSGKPEDIIKRMAEGRLKQYLAEVALLLQPFVKETSQTIEQLLKSRQAMVKHFVRYEVGEGIEKVTTDFVQEVMAQVKTTQ